MYLSTQPNVLSAEFPPHTARKWGGEGRHSPTSGSSGFRDFRVFVISATLSSLHSFKVPLSLSHFSKLASCFSTTVVLYKLKRFWTYSRKSAAIPGHLPSSPLRSVRLSYVNLQREEGGSVPAISLVIYVWGTR